MRDIQNIIKVYLGAHPADHLTGHLSVLSDPIDEYLGASTLHICSYCIDINSGCTYDTLNTYQCRDWSFILGSEHGHALLFNPLNQPSLYWFWGSPASGLSPCSMAHNDAQGRSCLSVLVCFVFWKLVHNFQWSWTEERGMDLAKEVQSIGVLLALKNHLFCHCSCLQCQVDRLSL